MKKAELKKRVAKIEAGIYEQEMALEELQEELDENPGRIPDCDFDSIDLARSEIESVRTTLNSI